MSKRLHNAPLLNFDGEVVPYEGQDEEPEDLRPSHLIRFWADNYPVTDKGPNMKQMRVCGEVVRYLKDHDEEDKEAIVVLETEWWDTIRPVMVEYMPKYYRLNAPVFMDEIDERIKLNGKVSDGDPDAEPELELVDKKKKKTG